MGKCAFSRAFGSIFVTGNPGALVRFCATSMRKELLIPLLSRPRTEPIPTDMSLLGPLRIETALKKPWACLNATPRGGDENRDLQRQRYQRAPAGPLALAGVDQRPTWFACRN